MADERDGGAGRDVEVEVVEDVRQLSVAEADVVEADVSGGAFQRPGVRGVDDVRLLVQHVRDAVERGGRGEERVVELRELLDRVEEVAEVQREREQRADRHVPLDDEPAADAEDDRRRDRREDVDRREVDPVQDHRVVVRLPVALVHAAEGRLARRLAGEGLDDAHARDVLGERRRHETEPLADVPVRPVRARPEPGGRERHQREDDERREGEAPVEEEEDDDGAGEDERVLDEARDAVRDEQVERLDVVRDPADDRARPVPLVVAERETLEMREELDAEVGERAFSDPAREVRLRAREDERRDACERGTRRRSR